MPPTFLTRMSHVVDVDSTDTITTCQSNSRIVDLKGSSPKAIWDTLQTKLDCGENANRENPDKIIHLVVPFLGKLKKDDNDDHDSIVLEGEDCYVFEDLYACNLVSSFGPHLTTEDVPPWDAGNSGLEFYQQRLVLNVYEIYCKD